MCEIALQNGYTNLQLHHQCTTIPVFSYPCQQYYTVFNFCQCDKHEMPFRFYLALYLTLFHMHNSLLGFFSQKVSYLYISPIFVGIVILQLVCKSFSKFRYNSNSLLVFRYHKCFLPFCHLSLGVESLNFYIISQ